jgi:hypothetical protein
VGVRGRKARREHGVEQDLGYQLAYQRGVQAVIWGMPAVSLASLREASFRDLGARYNDIVYMSNVPVSRHELLTASDEAPYVMVMLNVKEGPAVLEVPAATEKAAFSGSAVDGWMVPLVDIGASGQDAGKGGRYLFLPPGWQDRLPKGYLAVPSKTYNVHVALRSIPGPRASLPEAVAYSKLLRAYPLALANRSPANRYIDAYPKTWRTLPAYDMSYFATLAEAVGHELPQEKDAAMIGLLASIGIRKNTPFLPEGRLARALELAVKDGRQQMEHYFETPGLAMAPYRPDSHWMVSNSTPHEGATYLVDGRLLIDERAGGYSYWSAFAPKNHRRGLYSLCTLRDDSGQLLKGAGLYRLRVPGNVPASDFWSLIAYGKDSKAYIYNDFNRAGLSSRGRRHLQLNADGSVDLYCGPQAPKGKASNWIPTGRDFFLIFRCYGPEKALFERSFILPDVEKVR